MTSGSANPPPSIRSRSNPAAAKAAPETSNSGPGPVTARKSPARAGPASVPSPSIVASPTLAATSSCGERAREGSKAYWVDRSALATIAATVTSTYTTATGQSSHTAIAAAAIRAPRAPSTTAITFCRGKWSAGIARNGAASAAGTIRINPRMPTPSGPPTS